MEPDGPAGRNPTQTWSECTGGEDPGFTPPPRWRLGRQLGSGGQADVWLAQDIELGEWVAVKVFHAHLSDTTRERLRREVRLGRALQHPHLVRLFELIESDGRLAVVMEWVPGGSLAQRLEGGPLPLGDVIAFADETLAALEYLHGQGVVHRDVKPSNLLLDEHGHIRLADLGLARPLEDQRDLTQTNTAVGTPAFMSPEQIRGEAPIPATDLYGLGVTLFQLLTGALPFPGRSQYEVATQHLVAPVRDPRALRKECPHWLARFVLRLLEKQPEDRWPDAAAARRALHRRTNLTSPRARRRAMVAAALIAAGSIVAAVGSRAVVHAWSHPEAVRVEVSGQEVRGLDARGSVVWRRALEYPVRQVESMDLSGDGEPETIITAWPRTFSRLHEPQLSEVLILDRRGGVVTRVHPEDVLTQWPFEYPKSFEPIATVLNIGRGGSPAVVVNCRQKAFFPTVLMVFWPRTNVWEPVLCHPGWLYDIDLVPGSDPPRLRFEGVNNVLCMYPVTGELVVRDPEPSALQAERFIDLSQGMMEPVDGGFSLAWYTPLDLQGTEHAALAVAGNGDSVLRYPLATVVVDRFGNPVSGPNRGRDLRSERTGFLTQLTWLTGASQPLTPDGVRSVIAKARASSHALLAERPYRTIVGTLGARALARAGDIEGAIAMLEGVRADGGAAEPTYRLAHLEAIAGNLETARRLTQELLDSGSATRRYDAANLMLRLCIESHDEEGCRKAVMPFADWNQDSYVAGRFVEAIGVRARLWWDDLQEADTRVGSSAFVPEGESLACLARWRLGRTAPGDPEAMVEAEKTNPDAALECRLARGAALLGLGRAREAAAWLGQVVALLRPISRDDFSNRQVLDLAQAVYLRALLAAGDRAQAFAQAKSLRPRLRPGLLPRILVDEVLQAGDAGH